MDFFLDVGIYLLIVALAAAGAGFVALRLVTSGRAAAHGPNPRRFRTEASEEDGNAGGDDWAAPARVAKADGSSPATHPEHPVRTQAPAGSERASSAQAVEAAGKGDSATDVALESFEAALSQEAQPDGQKTAASAAPGPDKKEDAPAMPAELPEEGSIQTVVAPPDEQIETDPEDDSILSMFQASDAEESTVGDLANRLEDVDAAFLLATAKEIASSKAKVDKGGVDA